MIIIYSSHYHDKPLVFVLIILQIIIMIFHEINHPADPIPRSYVQQPLSMIPRWNVGIPDKKNLVSFRWCLV